MPILFLDFDGVLHPEHCHESKHFSCLPVFESVLSQVPDCKLVIASTWRLQIPVERLREKLGPDANDHMAMLEQNPERVIGYFQDRYVRYAA